MFEMLIPARPALIPPLEPNFIPAAVYNRNFLREVNKNGGGVPIAITVERADGSCSRFDTQIFDQGHPLSVTNTFYVERLLKFLLWQRGGCKVTIGGSSEIASHLKSIYAPNGARAFDYSFMGERVYQRQFSIIETTIESVPESREIQLSIGRHLDGCRIGFDLGASDIKVSAINNEEVIFTYEVEWNPREQTDPNYHYEKIISLIRMAAEKLPRVDAIGGSSAGVIINNRPMIASLFRGVTPERYDEVRGLFDRIRNAFEVPIVVINDGEVSALAGSMALKENALLGIAMGSSQAAGYITRQGKITNWLNELAFAPIDYNPSAEFDEWSGDQGVGGLYLSQQCVFRLSSRVGIDIPLQLSLAQKLQFIQEKLEAGHEGAQQIWESIGIILGYAIAHYSDFYDLEFIQLYGRVTSGSGGPIIIEKALRVLEVEFPEIAKMIRLELPDELSRRLGQSIAAASLPEIAK